MANLAPVPDGLTDEQVLMCPDIMSTGFAGAESGKIRIGETDGEPAELRFLLRRKGLGGSELDRSVTAVSSARELWIDLMLAGEFGLAPAIRQPLAAGLYTFAAFVLCSGNPLLPFAFGLSNCLTISLAAVALVFFGIGSLKSLWSLKPW